MWHFVGREPELALIATQLSAPSGRGVVILAEAGVGKSRLARAAWEAAQRDGAQVEWVQATKSAAAVPMGAFAGVLPADLRADNPLELMRSGAAALEARAAGGRLVLGVDDAQWLDPVSAALVLHVALTDVAVVLATVRSGEPCPDAITSLWKDAGAYRLHLQPLTEDDVVRLLEGELGNPVDGASLQQMLSSSGGNALYLHELVVGALATGTLREQRGLWRLTESMRVSASLADLVHSRMSGLDEATRGPVEVLALGEPLTVEDAAALAGYDALIAAESRGLVTVAGDSVRLSHPIYGDVIRQALPALRTRELRWQLAATVQRHDPLSADDALRSAHWLLESGADLPPELLATAARAANHAGDPDFAAELATRLIALDSGPEAQLLLARAHTARRRFDEAVAVLAPLEGGFKTQDLAAEYLELYAFSVLFWGLKRLPDAVALVQRAQGWWTDPAWRGRIAWIDHILGLQAGVRDRPVEVFEQDLAAADARVRLRIRPVYALGLFLSGRAAESQSVVPRPSVPLGDDHAAWAAALWTTVSLETGQDWPSFEAELRTLARDGFRANDNAAAGLAAYGLGALQFLRGRYLDGRRWFAEAEARLTRQDTAGHLAIVRAMQVGVAYVTGELDRAVEALDRIGHAPLAVQLAYVTRARAWALRARGDDKGARTLLLEAAPRVDSPDLAAHVLYDAMRAGAPAAELLERFRPSDGRLSAAYAAHAHAMAARDANAAMAASDAFAAIGAQRYAVEAALDAARLDDAEGRRNSARRALTRAQSLYVPDQGTAAPALDGVFAGASALTARERQLVELAAHGLTNTEIADRLVVSVRTVESHIYRAMLKLGINDRRELRNVIAGKPS
jgi:DNA-binding NarL/FixJ family response regulator